MKYFNLLFVSFIAIIFVGCSGKPSRSLVNEQYDITRERIKSICGEGYEVSKFEVVQEYFGDEEKTEYIIRYDAILNQPYMGREKGPGIMKFRKSSDSWKCTLNTIDFLRGIL